MPVNPLTLTTELDAVNAMLSAISESPVTTLETASHADAAAALTTLRFWNLTVQEEGWKFNTRTNVLLLRNGSDNIVPPINTLAIDTDGNSNHIDVTFIEGQLFDPVLNTFVWSQDLYCTYTLLYDYESIPQAARNYILQHAGLEYVGNRSGDPNSARFSEQRLLMSRAALRRSENKIKDSNMLYGSDHTLKAMIGRRPFTP